MAVGLRLPATRPGAMPRQRLPPQHHAMRIRTWHGIYERGRRECTASTYICIWQSTRAATQLLQALHAHPPRGQLRQALQRGLQVVVAERGVGHKLKELAHRERGHALAAEVVVDVFGVLAQEVKGLGVVQVHALRHVDDVQLALRRGEKKRAWKVKGRPSQRTRCGSAAWSLQPDAAACKPSPAQPSRWRPVAGAVQVLEPPLVGALDSRHERVVRACVREGEM